MKKYKFIIRKVAKKELEVEARNNKEAFAKIIQLLGENEKELFEKLGENNQVYEIKLDKILDLEIGNKKVDFNHIIDEILKKSEINLQKNNQIKEKNKEKSKKEIGKVEDDLIIETDEIICEKCGHHIQLDEIF